MELHDAVAVDDAATRITGDGYLVSSARVARTGIQDYAGHELDRPDMPNVRVYRPESEVFAADALRSYAHRPVTNNHPDENVDVNNWKRYGAGMTGDEVMRDGEYIRVPLTLMDAEAVNDFRAGKRELSMGYSCQIDFQDGVTPDGEQYDAIQSKLRMNHLALVDRARGGEGLKIGDHEPKDTIMQDTTLARVLKFFGVKDSAELDTKFREPPTTSTGVADTTVPTSSDTTAAAPGDTAAATAASPNDDALARLSAQVKEIGDAVTAMTAKTESESESKPAIAVDAKDSLPNAEIIVPGATVNDGESAEAFKRRVLTMAMANDADGIVTRLAGDPFKAESERIHIAFDAIAEIRRHRNNTGAPATGANIGARAPSTPSELNDAHAKHWATMQAGA